MDTVDRFELDLDVLVTEAGRRIRTEIARLWKAGAVDTGSYKPGEYTALKACLSLIMTRQAESWKPASPEGLQVMKDLQRYLGAPVPWLDKLEARLVQYYGEFDDECHEVPDEWRPWPWCYLGYGLREGCVNQSGPFWDDEDVCRGIIAMFGAFLRTVLDESGVKGWGLVEPSWEDRSHYLVVDEDYRRVLYHNSCKAWNFEFETPQELERELAEVYSALR